MNAPWPGPTAGATHTPALVPRLLREYGEAVRAKVAQSLAAVRPAPYLSDLVGEYPRRPGKMMRPGICIATARAFGARVEDVLAAAAAVELFHNALLVHDDIQDDSEVRRGRPTLHAEHGVPLAINAGDALMLLAMEGLGEAFAPLGARLSRRMLDETRAMAWESAEGQALELGWRRDNRTDVTEADYLTMVLKKTAFMSVIWPAQIGLLIGSGGAADPASVVPFGFFLGAAFQIQDDLLNFVGDAAYGKERFGDLLEGKRTLVLIHTLRVCEARERREIEAFLGLGRGARTPAMARDIVAILERHGSIDYARAFASALAGAAAREADRAFGALPASRDKEFLAGLIPWVFERS